MHHAIPLLFSLSLLMTSHALAHRDGHPPTVQHVASDMPPLPAKVQIEVADGFRTIVATGLPDHAHGRFPNAGNPNPIVPQNKAFRVTTTPRPADTPAPPGPIAFGVALNGIPFEPSAAEFWKSDRQSGWQYEALTGALNLGLDENHAHVQPNGKYHYHGIPTGLLKDGGKTPVVELVGYAADGFPIYGPWGYADPTDATSEVRRLRPGYRLKTGPRPDGDAGPGGAYDGTFVQDYEFVADGDLDKFNGRFGVTPEYPKGTYYYVVTEAWPYVAREFRGTPDDSFRFGSGGTRPPGPSGPPTGPPPPDGGRRGPPPNDPQALITAPQIKKELALTGEQQQTLQQLLTQLNDTRRRPNHPRGRQFNREPQEIRDGMRQTREATTTLVNHWLDTQLTAEQQTRWQQLRRQQQGMNFFISEEAKALYGYSDAQFAEIYAAVVTARTTTDRVPMPKDGTINSPFGRKQPNADLWDAIERLLTPAQRNQRDSTLGKRVELHLNGLRLLRRARRPIPAQ